jgi:SAM-dependent methyltransferase
MMISERYKDIYPCTSDTWFGKDNISKFNLESVKLILKDIDSKKMLDWGCGNLMWPIGLFPKAEVTGIERSYEDLKYASMNAKCNNVKFTPVHEALTEEIPLNEFDFISSFGLIEFLSAEEFFRIHNKMYKLLSPGGYMLSVFYNWRPFSAIFLPHLIRGGYKKYCAKLNSSISTKSISVVENDLASIGFKIVKSGGYNPYPGVLWPKVSSMKGFVTYNRHRSSWYYSQFVVSQKPW